MLKGYNKSFENKKSVENFENKEKIYLYIYLLQQKGQYNSP